jgi:dihydroneopterin aldolase/2-amino-4-hydroxy-6-hydroxymethyldihydropteridine diphosphokinase
VGDVRATLRSAIDEIAALDGVTLAAVSPLARTAAVGPEQDDYLNAVVVVRTALSPRELLAATSAIEDAHGRVRGQRWGPRTLDIDIVTIDGVASTDPVLELPHPRARDRAFVLVPWAQAEPAAELPGLGGGAVASLAETAPDRGGIRWLALDWWDGAPAAPDPHR